MSAPTLNTPLLARALRAAAAHPEHFDMGSWLELAQEDEPPVYRPGAMVTVKLTDAAAPAHCGTTACLAGWAIHESGTHTLAAVVNAEGSNTFVVGVPTRDLPEVRCNSLTAFTAADSVEYVAQQLLGLTPDQAARLFYQSSYAYALLVARDITQAVDPDRLHLLPTP